MNEWTHSDRRIGLWSTSSVVALWILYVCVGVIGVIARSPSPDPLHQVDPTSRSSKYC
jgi:hypothetical protein